MNIQIKKLREGAQLPTRGSEKAAGYDLYACLDEPVSIPPHTTAKIGTGLAVAVLIIVIGFELAKSSLEKILTPAPVRVS